MRHVLCSTLQTCSTSAVAHHTLALENSSCFDRPPSAVACHLPSCNMCPALCALQKAATAAGSYAMSQSVFGNGTSVFCAKVEDMAELTWSASLGAECVRCGRCPLLCQGLLR